jgi:hypothetical protein
MFVPAASFQREGEGDSGKRDRAEEGKERVVRN